MQKKIYSIMLSLLLLVLLAGCGNDVQPTSAQGEGQRPETEVSLGVTGTGIIEADNQRTVAAQVTGDIISADFEEGQTVTAGQVLYKIDSTDVQNSIATLKVNIEKAELAYNQNASALDKLNVKTNTTGTVTSISVTEGTMVAVGTPVAEVINDSSMILTVPFISEQAETLYAGQAAQVSLVGTFYTLDGTVNKITTGTMVSQDGSVVKMVEITVPNPGTVKRGDMGTAIVGTVACNDAGTFDYSASETVVAETSGRVSPISVSVGDSVTAGSTIVRLTNDTLTSARDSSSLALKEARLSLSNLNTQLAKYTVTSPIDGTVISKKLEVGDTLSAANMSSVAVIADLSKIIFKMDVDELDIDKVKVGQEVTFTADASPDKTFTGQVNFVGTSGKQVMGVTLYEVTVEVNEPDGLMPGMNVNARILTEEE